MGNFTHRLGLIAAVVAVGSGILSAPAIASEQWVRVKTDKLNNVWYVDKSSIQQQGKERLFWLYVVDKNPATIDNEVVKSVGAYLAINCQAKTARAKYLRLMDQDNNVVREYDLSSTKSRKLIPSRIDEGTSAYIKFVCAAK